MNTVLSRRNSRTRKTFASGFTLVEALIVLAIASILIAVGIPQLNTFVASRAMRSHVSLVASAMRLSRSEAVKRGGPVTICPSTTTHTATPSCSGGNSWESGWIIFTDSGNLGQIDGNDRVVRVQPILTDSAGINSAGGGAVSFFQMGVAVGGRRAFTFLPKVATADSAYNDIARRLCLDNSGSATERKFQEACP